jgi:xanthine dehydrogenase YagR molybdenum-binding subunit
LKLRDRASYAFAPVSVAAAVSLDRNRVREARVALGRVASGPAAKQYSMHSFGAVFAEVHVDPELGELRVERVVVRYAIGKLLNAKTDRSQLLGGVVWGIGMALLEDSIVGSFGARRIGEIGLTGVPAAIAHAAHHAAGVRVREPPITLDKLLV